MRLLPKLSVRFALRYLGHCWTNRPMLKDIAASMRISRRTYPHTWQCRVLIATYRLRQNVQMYGKGYGLDWKCLKYERDAKGKLTGRLVRDTGVALKEEARSFVCTGSLPFWLRDSAHNRAVREIQVSRAVLRPAE